MLPVDNRAHSLSLGLARNPWNLVIRYRELDEQNPRRGSQHVDHVSIKNASCRLWFEVLDHALLIKVKQWAKVDRPLSLEPDVLPGFLTVSCQSMPRLRALWMDVKVTHDPLPI